MIQVSLEPERLVVGHSSELTVRLTNTGRGVCTGVVFKLELPVQIVLLRGSDRLEVARLDAGESVAHVVQVRAKLAGEWTVTSTNFSYSDAFGMPQRIRDLRLVVPVAPAIPPATAPEPQCSVVLHTTRLPLKRWEWLEGSVVNTGLTELLKTKVRALGPLESDRNSPWTVLGSLSPGERAAFRIPVYVHERGSHVPIYLEVTHTDALGRGRHHQQFTPLAVGTSHAGDLASTPAPGTLAILFLAADPTDASRLRLTEEYREIHEKLRLSRDRDRFQLHQRLAVRPHDISQALLDLRPQIVYFSGHGTSDGALCFEDRIGRTHPVAPAALADLFELVAEHVQCVVLNACYSEAQANAIVQHIDHVIGMSRAIGDRAAIAFSIGFYQALGGGLSVVDAYKLGCVQIRLQGLDEHLTPVLKTRSGAVPHVSS
jgi:hypothetical protein